MQGQSDVCQLACISSPRGPIAAQLLFLFRDQCLCSPEYEVWPPTIAKQPFHAFDQEMPSIHKNVGPLQQRLQKIVSVILSPYLGAVSRPAIFAFSARHEAELSRRYFDDGCFPDRNGRCGSRP